MIGSQISHYRVLDELGRGGMGVVYRAIDTRLGREVALKLLPDAVAHGGPELARFHREARAASALNHPAICTVHDVGEHEGRHFIVMELLRGEPLARRLASGPLPMEEVRRLGIQLADALATAHAHAIVHRDVKPGNVFLTERGDAKLLDFGLAKAAAGESSATAMTLEGDLTAQGVVGTPSYMSPEQALGRPVDRRTDIFSLGALLYVMATGRRPFDAGSVPAILDAVLHREPEPVTRVNAAAWPSLGRVIVRCLAKDPAARYADARELRDELERLAPGDAPSVGPGATPYVGSRRRRVRIVGAAAAAAIFAVVVVALALRPGPTSSRPAPRGVSAVIAVLPFTNQTGDPANDYLGPALAAGLLSELGEIRALRLVSPGVLGTERAPAMSRAVELGSEVFVEGELRPGREAELRIDARVTDARSGVVLWSRPFEGSESALLELEGRMARGLAAFLSIPLSPAERARLARGPTASLEAMRHYAEGQLHLEGSPVGPGVERALYALESAVRLDPEFALAHAALAQALWLEHERTGDPARVRAALEAAERAAAIDPELPQARLALALVSGAAPGSDAAMGDVASILARHPRPSAAHRELGVLYEKAGRYDEAERALREAIALDPDDWFSWNWLGVFLFRHRDLDAAAEAFERAASLAPTGVTRPRENLGVLLIQQSRFEEAIAVFESVSEDGGDATTASNLGTAYFFSGRPDKWEQAERHFLEAVARDPRQSAFHGNLADLYSATGDAERARQHHRRAWELAQSEAAARPGELGARVEVALYGAKAGECGAALEEAARLRPEVPASSQALHDLAMTFSLCRDRGRALEALRAAIDAGFAPRFAAEEDEFRWLADDPDFLSITGPRS